MRNSGDFRPHARLQTGFTAGELAPAMYGRIDHEKYLLGLKRCHNFLVRTHGGISNRAGLKHLGLSYKNERSRLIPFQFNNEQAYLLEFGHQIMRVWMNGALVVDSAWSCPANTCGALIVNYQAYITFDTPPAEGDPPHLVKGDELRFGDNGTGHPSVNDQFSGRIFRVSGAAGDGVGFNLVNDYGYAAEDMEGGPSASDLEISKIYHLPTPYLLKDLPLLKFCQSADTITITHPSYKPRKLVRTGHDAWTLTEINFAPTVQPPTNLSGSCFSKDGFNTKARYRVTAVDNVTFEESTPVECEFKSNKSIGLPSLNVYTELTAQPHPIIENRLRWSRNTDSNVLRYNIYRSIAHSAFTYVGSAAGDEDPTIDTDTLVIDTITDSSHTTKRIKVKTVGDHGLATGDAVNITGVLSADTTGTTLADELNGNTYKVKKIDNNEFYLRVIDGNDYIVYPSGATNYQRISVTSWSTATPCVVVIPVGDNTADMDVGTVVHVAGATGADASDVNDTFFTIDTLDNTSSTTTISITLSYLDGTGTLDGAGKVITGGKMSTAFGNETDAVTHFVDRIPHTQTAMGVLDSPPPMTPLDPFDAERDYPECCSYHEQRLWFGGTLNAPNTLWASQIALYDNMNRKSPVAATDAVIITLPSTRVNPVYHILSMRDLLVFTGDGDWWVDSTEGAINAATARAQQQSYIPCSRYVAPLPVTHRVLYAEDRGKGVRELGYVDKSRGLQSIDRTVYARHLFDGEVINSMTYQSLPFSVVWATNESGHLLAMSYEPDQEVYAWSKHSRDGVEFVQAVVLSEGNYDNLYLLQRREVDTHPMSGYLYLIEQMHHRQFDAASGGRFVDSYAEVRAYELDGGV